MVLAIYGASGLGAEFDSTACRVNEQENKWEDIIFVDDAPEKEGQELVGRKIYPYVKALEKYGKENLEFLIGIGEPNVKDIVFGKLDKDGCTITNLFFPGTIVGKDSKLGRGIVVQDVSGIPPMSVIGNCVLLQGKTVLGHNIELGDNVVISSLTFVGGDTVIGRNTYIAPSSCLRNGLHIGENAIIGMGSVVTKDIPDNAVAYGNPCKVARINESGRVFKK